MHVNEASRATEHKRFYEATTGKWTDIANSAKKSTKTANITRCLQDFEKPRLFWLMNTFTRSRLTKIKVIFIIARSASTVSKSARNHIT